MRRSIAITAALAAGFMSMMLASPAQASAPPMTEEELMAASDLVVDARAVGVACAGPVEKTEYESVSTYLSTLEVTQTYKGEVPADLQVRGYVVESDQIAGCDPRTSPLEEGFEGKLYLVMAADGIYDPTDYSGIMEAPTSAPKELPACESSVDPDPTDPNPADPGDPEASSGEGSSSCATAAPGAGSRGLGAAALGLLALGLTRLRRRR